MVFVKEARRGIKFRGALFFSLSACPLTLLSVA